MDMMEGDNEIESKLEVPGEMERKSRRIRRLSGSIVLQIQNDPKISGMIMVLDQCEFDGNKEAKKAVHHVLHEDEKIGSDKVNPGTSGIENNGNSEEKGNSDHHAEFYIEDKPPDKQDEGTTIENDENPDCYTINHTVKEHGLAFILSYGQFESENMELTSRVSSIHDYSNMRDILEVYGCKVMLHLNGVKTETLNFLKEVEKEWNTGKYDILIGSVSSHGDEVVEARTEGEKHEVRHRIICKDGNAIYTDEDLVHRFDTKGDKPKLYFIQACRSRFSGDEAKDQGTYMTVSGASKTETSQQENRGQDTPDARGIRAPPSPQKPATPKIPAAEENNSQHAQTIIIPETDANLQQENRGQDAPDTRGIRAPPSPQKPATTTTPVVQQNNGQHPGIVTEESNQNGAENSRYLENDRVDARGQVCDTEKKDDVINESTKEYKPSIPTEQEPSSDPSAVQPKPDARVSQAEIYEVIPPPCSLDSLVMFASAEGKFAYSSSSGGWLLSLVEKALQSQKNGEITELTQLLTQHVSNTMALDMETINENREDRGLKSVPCIIHMLRKDIFLKPLPSGNSKV
ncbi:hypothetical protein KUTeg_001289 [Tegillarca granosa]|uniref:Caspase family p20 domain-containing protein n=1 Tax=Tegillarca granosa TaxID=220873 RepID=A0ABQ9FVA9_TEGGR|nr:hypothetical protein KUTeg_001289 [Tegillarca granosa]